MYKKQIYITLIVFLSAHFLFAQKGAKEALKLGNEYFTQHKYSAAIEQYQLALGGNVTSAELQKRLAISYYKMSNVDEALPLLTLLANDSKTADDAEVLLYTAKCYHANVDFKEAIKWYKKYLAVSKSNSPQRNEIKNDIKRCASGLKIKDNSAENFVQNLGENANSEGDDFAPLLSPRSDEKIYFSSARASSLGGLRDAKGLRDDKNGAYSSDIFSIELENGEWKDIQPLSYLLNGPRHDVALDFDDNGQKMYYYRGFNLQYGALFVDTFKTFEERNLASTPFISPIDASKGDGTPFFINDTTILFSSARGGGYGGADLYYTILEKGKWRTPVNLGAPVNTPYDELCPFLTNNGRQLFFSSNNTKSIGGFDIFTSTYFDDSLSWSKPMNMGLPINSAGDDAFFRLTNDGSKAYFSSERKGGFGQRDLYSVFFKQEIEAQTTRSTPDLFFKVPAYKAALAAKDTLQKTKIPKQDAQINIDIAAITYDKDNDIVAPKNQKTIGNIITVMKKNPTTLLRLVGHSAESAGNGLDAFMVIKRLEKLADYITKAEVGAERITLLSCGANYPQAQNALDGEPSVAGQKLNRRIDIQLLNEDKSYKIVNESTDIPEYLQSGEYFRFKNIDKGLSYRVQVATIKQMYNGELINKYPDVLIEKNASENVYHYTIGLFVTYDKAERLRKELDGQGISSAMVVPYIAGWKMSDDDIRKFLKTYPDLQNYLNRKK